MKLDKSQISGKIVDTSRCISKGIRVLAGALAATVIVYSAFFFFPKEDALLPDEAQYELPIGEENVPDPKVKNGKSSNPRKMILRPTGLIKEQNKYDWE